MKSASLWETMGARVWNVLNEGKPFTIVFVSSVFLFYHLLFQQSSLILVASAFAASFPLFVLYACYDYPLKLRWYLWFPFVFFLGIFGGWDTVLLLLAIGLYFFFTVFFWGSFYYHWRIGIPLDNYKRFWRLVLVHSDSTSGNAQEQLPKIFMLLTVMNYFTQSSDHSWSSFASYGIFVCVIIVYTMIVHRIFFDWRPEEPEQLSTEINPAPTTPLARKVIMIVIDGCRKDRLAEAHTPFIDQLYAQGTEFTQMETIYPARTVVCFSSIFTGAYPRDHGIKSNFVLRPKVRCESIFDVLRKQGKKGKLLGIAHLLDAFGEDVEAMSAVVPNDEIDCETLKRAKYILEQEELDLFAVQLIAVDQTGHSRGALYEEYKQKIEEADRHIATFYQWLEEEGHLQDAVLMLCADHGQSDGIGGHAHLDEGERYPPFVMLGPGIRKGYQVHERKNLTSIAPTISYLLGIPYPRYSRGSVLLEALEERDYQR